MDLDTTNLVVLILALLISITIHEAMHAFTGYWLGDDTAKLEGRISLNPLKHIDPFSTLILPIITTIAFGIPILAAKPVPFNPNRVKYEEFGAALIAVAGPLTNLVLAILSALFLNILNPSLISNTYLWIHAFVQLNVALFVFNMIPIPPLDGSRVLYAFAPEALQNVMAQLEQFGIFVVFGLILLVPQFTDLLVNIDEAILRFIT